MSAYKINRVLVGVDLSESSLNALDTAVHIALKQNALLYILHVDENNFQTLEEVGTPYYSNSANVPDVITALAGTITHTHHIKPQIVLEEGNVAESIIKTSIVHQVDLVVMGGNGASGYRDGFVGNNTYNVIKYASCPVLSVPHGAKHTSFQKILFPIRPVTGALIPYDIVRLFTNPNTILEVMGLTNRMIIDTKSSMLHTLINEIKDQLNQDQVMARSLWSEGIGIADEIVNYSNKTNPDLVVVTSALDVTSKPKYIGPHAQKIINCSKVPVLSIKKIAVPVFV